MKDGASSDGSGVTEQPVVDSIVADCAVAHPVDRGLELGHCQRLVVHLVAVAAVAVACESVSVPADVSDDMREVALVERRTVHLS